MLTLDLSKLNGFLPQDYLSSREDALREAARMLAEHNGPGGDFTGWVTLPGTMTRRSSPASRRRPSASSSSPRCWWSSASAAPIWAPGR